MEIKVEKTVVQCKAGNISRISLRIMLQEERFARE